MALNYHKHNDVKSEDEMYNDVEEEEENEDDYIDMEVTPFNHFFPKDTNTTLSSPQHGREFEFHMSSINVERDSLASPADELFYKGKLLPLHLPPRLEMVEKLLLDSPSLSKFDKLREVYDTPLGTNAVTTPMTSTPFESCNISPVESCQVSREISPHEYFGSEYSSNCVQQKGFVFISNLQKMSWSKKLKSKITKIKALFGKSVCSDESRKIEKVECLKVPKKNPFGEISSVVSEEGLGKENQVVKEDNVCHRRSFSGAFKRRSSITKLSCSSSSGSSSSSSSSSSSVSNNDHLKRTCSANLEIETSLIQGAIAHCKQSQETLRSRKTLSEVGCHSFPSRFVAFDDQTSATGVCRG